MAKAKSTVNKSAAIRELLDAGVESPKLIVEQLATKGIEVSSAQVSTTKTGWLKSKLESGQPAATAAQPAPVAAEPKKRGRKPGSKNAAASSNGTAASISVDDLRMLSGIAKRVGGLKQLAQVVEALSE